MAGPAQNPEQKPVPMVVMLNRLVGKNPELQGLVEGSDSFEITPVQAKAAVTQLAAAVPEKLIEAFHAKESEDLERTLARGRKEVVYGELLGILSAAISAAALQHPEYAGNLSTIKESEWPGLLKPVLDRLAPSGEKSQPHAATTYIELRTDFQRGLRASEPLATSALTVMEYARRYAHAHSLPAPQKPVIDAGEFLSRQGCDYLVACKIPGARFSWEAFVLAHRSTA